MQFKKNAKLQFLKVCDIFFFIEIKSKAERYQPTKITGSAEQ